MLPYELSHNLRVNCQRRTLILPLNSGGNAIWLNSVFMFTCELSHNLWSNRQRYTLVPPLNSGGNVVAMQPPHQCSHWQCRVTVSVGTDGGRGKQPAIECLTLYLSRGILVNGVTLSYCSSGDYPTLYLVQHKPWYEAIFISEKSWTERHDWKPKFYFIFRPLLPVLIYD